MSRFEMLDPTKHSQLRMCSNEGDEPHFARLVLGEFAMAAASCPIMLTKDPETGDFLTIAVLGLKPGEGALKDAAERGGFTPLALQCHGFFTSDEHVVVDLDHPRFSETEGEPMFTESLQPNDCLRQIQIGLGKLQAGEDATGAFIRALTELNLVESIEMSLKFDDGEQLTLKGLYTVSLDALREVDDAAAMQLFRAGYLEFAYLMAASLKQFNVLAQLRNHRFAQTSKKVCT